MPDVPDLSQAAANARATPDELPEGAPEAPSTIPVHTAFIVFQTTDGNTLVTPDLNAPFVPMREPSRDEMYGMLATALKDISATEVAGLSAETVIQRIEQKQQAAMKAAQDAMIRQQLNQGVASVAEKVTFTTEQLSDMQEVIARFLGLISDFECTVQSADVKIAEDKMVHIWYEPDRDEFVVAL